MKVNSVNNQIALVVTGISSPQLLLWKPLIEQLISDEMEIVYYTGSCLCDEDTQVIQKIGKESLTVERFDEENLPISIKWVLFTNTPNELKNYSFTASHHKLACFFGGITSENLSDQAEAAINLNINTLFSDLMPSEVRESLTQKCFSFFVERNCFLPPAISPFGKQTNSLSEESLFIFNCDETETSARITEIYTKIFKEIDSFRVVDLSKCPVDEWIAQCTPSKNCKKIITDISYRVINQFLINLCSSKKIEFQSLGTRGALTPERTFLEKSENSDYWLRQIAPTAEPSLREKTLSLLRSIPHNSSDEVSKGDSSSASIKPTIISSLLTEDTDRTSHEFLSKLREHYSKDHEIKNNNASLQYLTSPFSYLFEDAPHRDNLKSSMEFFISQPKLSESNSVFENLVGVGLRLISRKEINTANYHIIHTLQSKAPLQTLNQYSLSILQDPQSQANRNLGFYIVHNLLTMHVSKEVSKLYYDQLLRLPLPAEIISPVYLATKDFDSLGKLTQDSAVDGHKKGIVGNAVYYNIHKSSVLLDDDAKIYEELCRDEIAKGKENLSTSYSLALLEILSSEKKDFDPISTHTNNPSSDILRNIIFCRELALLSLALDKAETANFFLSAHENSLGVKTAYHKLSAILISILLDKIDLAESLSQEYMEKEMESPWNENVRSVYHLALFHALLFRMTQKVNSERKAKVIMDASLIAHDPFFQKLFPRIEATEKLKADSPIFSLIERLEQELPSL